MRRVTEGMEHAAQPHSDHTRLLEETIERFVVLRHVMRLTVQQCRANLARSSATELGAISATPEGLPAIGEAQFHVLHVLTESPNLTVGEIADRCHVTAPTISKMLNHLEASRLIERHLDPSNRRVVHVVLTDTGRTLYEAMEGVFKEALARVLDPLTDQELRDVIVAFGHFERLVDRDA